MGGQFWGLVEGPDCDILTMKGEFLIRLSLGKDLRNYQHWELIKLSVLETFDNWVVVSKPRHLAYSQGKVYITDQGLHKILLVDLASQQQDVTGYLGTELGQFKKPTGIITDQVGNLLVIDRGNNRLLVFSNTGVFIKEFCSPGRHLRLAASLRLVGDMLWIAYTGMEGALVGWHLKSTE